MDSANFALPLLDAAQAQKEITHNEAIVAIDIVLSGTVEGESASPPADPAAGRAWIVGDDATGAWQGQRGAIAYYISGWRFIRPPAGMRVRRRTDNALLSYDGTDWNGPPRVAFPPAGADHAELAACVTNMLATLVKHGLVAI